ncbi:MAG: FAD-dependent oxidoreductase [Legionellaceae bacterium]|nr:FAD-dependent oxidoreductase [Legionellaceae bacterium]
MVIKKRTQTKIKKVEKSAKRIAIIGGGWYGVHLSLVLQNKGYDVIILEEQSNIMSVVSGTFGIRTHRSGLHYPRSRKAQEICQRNYGKFCKDYPDLLVKNKHSIHAYLETDANGNPSKISLNEFLEVCQRDPTSSFFDQYAHGYQGLSAAVSIDEPSILVGEPLREALRARLSAAGVDVAYDYSVQEIKPSNNGQMCIAGINTRTRITTINQFDRVINATGFQHFIPDDFKSNPFGIKPIYQVCLGLVYEDTKPGAADEQFTFLGLDGGHWAAMPCGKTNHGAAKYMITHGIHTILASCNETIEAQSVVKKLNNSNFSERVRLYTEQEIEKYLPTFKKRFKYIKYEVAIIAKPLTRTEFRCAFTFADSNRVIQVFPGKVTGIYDIEKEVLQLINDEQCEEKRGYSYIKGGVLDQANKEIQDKPDPTTKEHNTCLLNPYPYLTGRASFWSRPPQPSKEEASQPRYNHGLRNGE